MEKYIVFYSWIPFFLILLEVLALKVSLYALCLIIWCFRWEPNGCLPWLSYQLQPLQPTPPVEPPLSMPSFPHSHPLATISAAPISFVFKHPSSFYTSSSIPWGWFWEHSQTFAMLVWYRGKSSFILATTYVPSISAPTSNGGRQTFSRGREPPRGRHGQTYCSSTPPRIHTGWPSFKIASENQPPLPIFFLHAITTATSTFQADCVSMPRTNATQPITLINFAAYADSVTHADCASLSYTRATIPSIIVGSASYACSSSSQSRSHSHRHFLQQAHQHGSSLWPCSCYEWQALDK